MLDFRLAPAVAATAAPPYVKVAKSRVWYTFVSLLTSSIPRAQAWATSYRASSQAETSPVLDLSQGVPRSPPHPTLLKALSESSSDPTSAKYGPILGEPSLRSALATEFNDLYTLEHDKTLTKEEIAITTGCNMAFLVLLMVLCPPGSKALLPLPAYFNQSMSCSLQSVTPMYIPCLPNHQFKPSIIGARKYLENDKKKEIRMIVLVTPSNPTGTVYSPEELLEWYNLAKEFKVALVLDETYRDFVGDDRNSAPHGLFSLEGWGNTLISIGSMSKGYRIPGHRLGSIIASPELLQQVTTVADCMQICAPRPPQLALASTLPLLRQDLLESSQALLNRLNLFKEIISRLDGWEVSSMGGYYAYVEFPSDYTKRADTLGAGGRVGSEDVARYLAQEIGVVCLPGSFFMPEFEDPVWEEIGDAGGGELKADRWLRFAIANVDDEVVRSLEPRLKRMNELMGMSLS